MSRNTMSRNTWVFMRCRDVPTSIKSSSSSRDTYTISRDIHEIHECVISTLHNVCVARSQTDRSGKGIRIPCLGRTWPPGHTRWAPLRCWRAQDVRSVLKLIQCNLVSAFLLGKTVCVCVCVCVFARVYTWTWTRLRRVWAIDWRARPGWSVTASTTIMIMCIDVAKWERAQEDQVRMCMIICEGGWRRCAPCGTLCVCICVYVYVCVCVCVCRERERERETERSIRQTRGGWMINTSGHREQICAKRECYGKEAWDVLNIGKRREKGRGKNHCHVALIHQIWEPLAELATCDHGIEAASTLLHRKHMRVEQRQGKGARREGIRMSTRNSTQ